MIKFFKCYEKALDVMLSDLLSCFLVSGGLASISAFMAENYVEMIHSFVLVNVPNFISAIW